MFTTLPVKRLKTKRNLVESETLLSSLRDARLPKNLAGESRISKQIVTRSF